MSSPLESSKPQPPPGDADRYFIVFGAAQDALAWPTESHVFATFLHLHWNEDSAKPKLMKSFTMSWIPTSGDVRMFADPEPGRNMTHAETLAWATQRNAKTKLSGPFEMTAEGFERSLKQWERLNSGQVAYKMLDGQVRPDKGTNCIHAISDVVPGELLQTGLSRGFAAADMLVAHFRPFLIEPGRTHDWVMKMTA